MKNEEWEYEWIPIPNIPIPRTPCHNQVQTVDDFFVSSVSAATTYVPAATTYVQ